MFYLFVYQKTTHVSSPLQPQETGTQAVSCDSKHLYLFSRLASPVCLNQSIQKAEAGELPRVQGQSGLPGAGGYK